MSSNGSGYGYPYSSAGYYSSAGQPVTPRYAGNTYSVSGSSSAESSYSYGGSSQGYYTPSNGDRPSYDEFRMPNAYSISPPPSTHTALSTFGQGIAQRQVPAPASTHMLSCEFRPWTGCQQEFRLDEVDLWIRHAEDDHLQGVYPTMCICWYCGDFDFNTQRGTDAGMNFFQRMQHIAGHMLDGYRFEERRPDFHFLEHVYRAGMISYEAYQQAKGASEGPTAPTGVYPSGWRPVRPEVVTEVAGPRRRRPSRRHQ
ncbi:hypothetical protein EsH8_II_000810 [Colletotrichum jinshuiense]